jgi:tetratricopeptide (TPR) repeat protein
MQKPFAKIIFLVAVMLSHQVYAQNNSLQEYAGKPISVRDSLLVNRYLDSVNVVSIFSQKRQRYLDSALTIAPWEASWWQQKAMPLFKQKKYETGMPYLDSAVKYDAHSYIDYRAFIKCIFQKSYRAAIKDFEAAKVIIGDGDVMDHTYDFYIGLCYLQLNQFDSAEIYLVKTTDQQRKSMGSHWVHPLDLFYLGIVYYEKEDYTKAIETLDTCLSLYPNFSDAKFYKAMCFARSNKQEEAITIWKEAARDHKLGYTINEDNAEYETYPYQVSRYAYEGADSK